MKETSKTRPSKVLLLIILLVVTLTIIIVGLYPTGIAVTNLKDIIRVYDKLYTKDFNISYTNRFKINLPISKNKQQNIKVEPSEISVDTREISISLGKYEKKLLTSPIQVRHIETSIDNIDVYEGDKLDTDNITAYLIYEDNTKLDITEEIKKTLSLDEYTFISNEKIEVDSKYGTIELKPIIHSVESITGNIEGIGIETGVWYSGEKPVIDSINITYSNRETRNIKITEIRNAFKLSESLLNIEELQPGINTYNVNYVNKQFEFSIEAIPFIKSIEVANKTVFLQDETIESVKNKIKRYQITYEDGNKETIASEDINIINTDNTITLGENLIEVEYLGRKFNLTITGRAKTKGNIAANNLLDELEKSNYSYIYDNIFVTITNKTKGSGEYWLTHIIVNDVSQIKGGLSYDTFDGTREKPTNASERLNWVVGGNASYFSYATGEPACAGVFIKNGQIIKGTKTNGGEVCLKSDGTIFTPSKGIEAQALLDMGVTEIWGTSDPLLIQDGIKQDLTGKKTNTYPRCAIGVVAPGEYYMITAGKNGYKAGLSFSQLQDIFGSLGCVYARSLDGGGSATLVLNNKLINSPAAGSERPVVDFIYFTK